MDWIQNPITGRLINLSKASTVAQGVREFSGPDGPIDVYYIKIDDSECFSSHKKAEAVEVYDWLVEYLGASSLWERVKSAGRRGK